SQVNFMCLGIVLDALGRAGDAHAAFSRMLELDPHFWWGWWQLGLHHAMQGSRDEARGCAQQAHDIFPSGGITIGLPAGAPGAGGSLRAEALLGQVPPDSYPGRRARTCFHLVRGEYDAALDWVAKVADQRDPTFFQSAIRPFQHVLNPSSRWPALLRKMNLTE